MKKSILAMILAAMTVTGCVPAAVVGAGAAVGGVMAGRDSRSLQAISDDNAIQYQANQKILSDKKLVDESHIVVTSFNYVVLLVGEVPSDAMRARAESLVQSVPLVRRVYNQLQVAPNEGFLQAADDSTITTNISARMVATSDLNSNNFKIVVENKVVYLLGYASHAQTQSALEVIRTSSGVKRVVNLVQYDESNQDTLPQKPPVVNADGTKTDASTTTNATSSVPSATTTASTTQQETIGTTAFVPVSDSSKS